MSDRSDPFEGNDPIAIANRWLSEAEATEPNDPSAAALATVDAEGLPDVRMVLVKQMGPEGVTFFTNYGSAKARQIEGAGAAALVLHWKSLRRQVRLRGPVQRVDGPEADAYFASRAPESRVGAWASRQSEPIASRQVLLDAVQEVRDRFGPEPPRPPFWGGFRIVPSSVELWADGANRLHDRFRWSRTASDAAWDVTRLAP
jgi:pyridoxamine 5'-phosphate oxidase